MSDNSDLNEDEISNNSQQENIEEQNEENEEEQEQNENIEEEEDINEEYINEGNYNNDELTVEELHEKIKRSGVLYMSRVPIGMKIIDIRKLLDDYGIQRCYFVPYKKKLHNVDGKRVQAYKEGWIEFEDKIYAKLAEYQLNGKPIGGNKKCIYRDELWNLKYLHKFKWNDLVESMTMERKIQEKKLKMEIAQSKRENDFIIKNYEKSKKYLNKKREMEKDNNNEDIENKEKEKNDNNNKKIKNIEGKEFNKKDYSKYKQKKLVD
jgi:ESF2/ABP1 family protein